MPDRSASILRTGMTTSVGFGSAQTTAAIAAGVSGFAETAFHDRFYAPFVMATLSDELLPTLDATLMDSTSRRSPRQTRMLRLAGAALAEAMEGLAAPESVPLFLAGPEPPRGCPGLDRAFVEALAAQAGVRLDCARSRVWNNGRPAGLLALQAAIEMIENSDAPRVLVGGVDTYLDPLVLGELDRNARIKSGRVLDGFIPGEAAAFVLVGPPTADVESGLAHVSATAAAEEPGHLGSSEPYRGDGLAETFTALFARAGDDARVETVLADLNGESWGAKEWGVALTRNHGAFDADFQLLHPADCVGDTGAASGPLLLSLAATGLREETLAGPCLVWCSSAGPQRAAALIAPID